MHEQSAPPPDLLTLLYRARSSGDAGAAEALVAQLDQLIRRFLKARFASRRTSADDLEDLAQEALIHVAAGLPTCRAASPGEFHAWVLTVARHAAIDHLRRLRDIPRSSTTVSLDDVADPSDRPDDMVDHLNEAPNPRTADAAARDDPTFAAGAPPGRVLQALACRVYAELPVDTQELLWLRLIRGDSWEAIGRALQASAPAAKRRFQRAQHRLANALLQRVQTLEPAARDAVLALLRRWHVPWSGPSESSGDDHSA